MPVCYYTILSPTRDAGVESLKSPVSALDPSMIAPDYAKARENMVEQQVRPWDVLDVRVLDVLSELPREAFVPPAFRALAYADLPVPLGHGQAMLKPVVEGRMRQSLALQPSDEVLEVDRVLPLDLHRGAGATTRILDPPDSSDDAGLHRHTATRRPVCVCDRYVHQRRRRLR